jgi:hypothetical protein
MTGRFLVGEAGAIQPSTTDDRRTTDEWRPVARIPS